MSYPKPSNELPGVYIVEVDCPAGQWFKIGAATDFRGRIAGLQTGCPITYSRIFCAEIGRGLKVDVAEAEMHLALTARAHHGEWFSGLACEETRELLAGVCLRHGIAIKWNELKRERRVGEMAQKRSRTRLIRSLNSLEFIAQSERERQREENRRSLTASEVSAVYSRGNLSKK